MIVAVAVALFLIVSTSLFHISVLRWLSGGMSRIAMRANFRLLIIVIGSLGAHVIEVCFYSAAYFFCDNVLGLGTLSGRPVVAPLDYLYFSIVTYTSLGLGDVVPTGHLRFITGIEALNGLLLIAWSGSFIYIAMGRLWPWRPCAEPTARPANR
ncbi:MAG: ion channel [Hyphomicrobiaceae bacterium]